jgi:hypothetical protein
MFLNLTLLIVVPPGWPDFAAPEHRWKRTEGRNLGAAKLRGSEQRRAHVALSSFAPS